LLAVSTVIAFPTLSFLNESNHDLSSTLTSFIKIATPRSGSPRPATGLIVVSQRGFTNDPLPIGITLTEGSSAQTVALLGLTAGFELSLGISDGAGSWLLSAGDLDLAFLGPPKDFVGSMEVMVELHSASGQLLDSKPVRYEWVAKNEEQEQTGRAVRLEPSPAAQTRDPADIANLIERAEALLRNGDIVSARLLLKRAATDGSAQAAFALATTFDPEFLGRLRVVGVDPDETEARNWYERASMLGSVEASFQLKRLARRP
jgi:hypothetical protein